MENIFNFNRFWLLIRQHANENWKLFLFFLISTPVPVICEYLTDQKPSRDELYFIYIFYMIFVGAIYTTIFLKDWSNIPRSVSYLMMPVTALEKLLMVVFYSVILFIPVFSFIYYYSCLFMSNMLHPEIYFSLEKFFELEVNSVWSYHPALAISKYVLLPYIFIHSLFLLSAVWFKKLQFLKAMAGIITLICAFYFWEIHFFNSRVEPNRISLRWYELFPTEVQYWGKGGQFFITSPILTTISFWLYSIIPVIIYVASYLKLKEKEI